MSHPRRTTLATVVSSDPHAKETRRIPAQEVRELVLRAESKQKLVSGTRSIVGAAEIAAHLARNADFRSDLEDFDSIDVSLDSFAPPALGTVEPTPLLNGPAQHAASIVLESELFPLTAWAVAAVSTAVAVGSFTWWLLH